MPKTKSTSSSRRPRAGSRQTGHLVGIPLDDRIRGYHLSRLYSPLANIRQMVYDGQDTTLAARQSFMNSVLGETFVPEGGQLTLDILDRCRRDYRIEEATR